MKRKLKAEEILQIEVVTYLNARLPNGWIVQHTANKPRSRTSGAIEKRMGAQAGWPDIGIYGPRRQVIFIELKAGTDTRESQDDMHMRLTCLGFPVKVARSLTEVADFIDTALPHVFDEIPAASQTGCAGEAGSGSLPAELGQEAPLGVSSQTAGGVRAAGPFGGPP